MLGLNIIKWLGIWTSIVGTNVLAQARRASEPGKTARRNPALPGANGSTLFHYLCSSNFSSFSASSRVASVFASVRAFRRYGGAASRYLFRKWYGKLRAAGES